MPVPSPGPGATPEDSLYEWFAASARRWPDFEALRIRGVSISYRRLADLADGLAGEILRTHPDPPRRIGLLAARSLVAYAGYLAAQRLGAAVVPLNPGFPPERNQTICALAEVDLVIVDDGAAGQAVPELHSSILLLSDAQVAGRLPARPLPPYRTGPENVAYVLFTSGSTGRPKGVPIRHANLAPYLAHNIGRYAVGPGCRVSHTFDLTFDLSIFDLFVTWGGGATLVVPARSELLTPVDYLVDHAITHWFSVPSVITVAAGMGNLPTGRVTELKHAIFCGEQLTYAQAAAWHDVAPGAVIDNVYGPTELTLACTEYRLPADPAQWPRTSNDTVPIGAVYPGLDHRVVDEELRCASEGELVIRGPQRFGGYLDPADNDRRFLDPAEPHRLALSTGTVTADAYYRTGDRVRREGGVLIHLGRLDNQVKIRGYRIELGEVEAAMRRHPAIGHAVAVAHQGSGETELAGFYTGQPLPALDLITWLRRRIPMYMVPRRYHHVDEFPLNANGKVDRARLAQLLAPPTPDGHPQEKP